MVEGDFIKFLGTAGARHVVSRQLRASGGQWLRLADKNILVDPGPGCLVKCWASRPKMDPATLDAIILTHRHLDHSNDINVMIEAMTQGGTKPRGEIFAPADAVKTEPVLLSHVRQYVAKFHFLKAGGHYPLADALELQTPILHEHGVETYGLVFETPDYRLGHIVDTLYFPELEKAYARLDILIINVVRFKPENDKARGILHLNLEDVRRLIAAIKPRATIMTHFGMTIVRRKPWEIAKAMSDELNCRIIAASDGATIKLEDLLN